MDPTDVGEIFPTSQMLMKSQAIIDATSIGEISPTSRMAMKKSGNYKSHQSRGNFPPLSKCNEKIKEL